MTAIITIKIDELSDVMSTSVEGLLDGATGSEAERAVLINNGIKAILNDLKKPTPGCNCPACKKLKGGGNERPNLH
ncbi:hypothetical protein FD733_02200 [Pantoea sp. Eser]|nr:hypothetical protein [Pantoea sp. Eser]